MNDRLFRVGALLGGAAIIATAMAVNPATANDLHQLLKSAKVKNCSSSNACIGGNNSSSGPGVVGTNSSFGNGVFASAANNDGVSAQTTNPSITQKARSGVYGNDASTDGGSGNCGVCGHSVHGTGVAGYSDDNFGVTGFGNVYGVSGQGSLAGVAAFGNGEYALTAQSSSGAKAPTIEAIGGTSGDTSGLSLYAGQSNGTFAFEVDNAGNAHVNGLIYTHGGCSAGCDSKRGGSVVSYAAQSSMPVLEDFGAGQLQAGVARIRFDASFAGAIDRNAAYAVFVSPEGPNRGMYVTQKTASGFTVMENDGGRSTIPFSYRIMARPYGVTAARLPFVAAAQTPKLLPARAPAHSHR
jgi:hypothetical protein